MKWTKRNITHLKKLWNEGLKAQEIADRMSRSVSSVRMKINGLQKSGELDYRHKDKRRGLDPTVKKAVKKVFDEYPKVKGWDQKSAKEQWAKHTKKKYADMLKAKKEATTKVIVHSANVDNLSDTQKNIERECDDIKEFLIRKNEAYGDSAITPIRIFSQSDAQEQIKVRIDDKLNRLMQGKNTLETDEDVIKDLIGYLVLLLIQMK